MTVSSTTTKVSASGDGSTAAFNYTFKIFADSEMEVIIRSSTGTETTKTLTTHYTVSGAGNDAGGTVTFTSGNIPASGETVVLRRNLALTQGTDYVENDPFPANSHEDGLDRLTMITQGIQEELDRAIKASKTNTISSVEFAISAADRANKIFAFDGSGDLSVTQELGTYQGDWSASTDYNARDIVKDTSTNNIFLCNTSHTSSGSQPLTTNTDSAKWDLLVDAASATASATAAAASATAAASSATASASSATSSASSATSAATAQTAAETAQAAAETAQAAAELAADNFDDTYLGSKASDPTVDNDGDALTSGDLYFNTTSNELKVYNGSAWQVAAVSASGLLAASNNLSDVASAATARTNLGASTVGANVFTAASAAAAQQAMDVEVGVDVQAYDADNAVTDAAQTFTVSQRGTQTTDNDLSFDLDVTNNFKCTPTGTGTLTFTNHTAGQSGNILLDNSGGHAISLAATTKGDANLASTISTAGTYWLSYYDDGTNAYVVTSAVFA